MGLFGIGKKKEVIDLSERYHRQQEQEKNSNAVKKQTPSKYVGAVSADTFSLFAKKIVAENSPPEILIEEDSDSPEEKKRKLAKRIADMTDRIEELNTQIYHLQQRIEVIEQKMRVGVGG